MPASHMNFLIANGAVIVPTYGDARAADLAVRGWRRSVPGPRGHRPAVDRHPDGRRILPLHHPAGARLMARTISRRRPADLLWRGHAGEHRQDHRPDPPGGRQGRAGHPAVGTVPGPLFLRHPGRELVRHRPSVARAPMRDGARSPSPPNWASSSRLDLRARGTALFQQPGHAGRRRLRRWASIARATSPTAPAIRRNTISGPATPASRSGTRATAVSASASAGTSGTRKPPAPWRCRAPRCCSIRPPSAPSRTTRSWTPPMPWRRAMQGHAVSNVDPRGRRQPHRHRAGVAEGGPGLLRLVLHRRPSRRSGRKLRPRRRGGAGPHLRPGLTSTAHRAAWGFFRDRRTDLYGSLVAPRPA